MSKVKFSNGDSFPLEMHKVCIVQKLNLPNVDERLKNIKIAGNNTFLLNNRDVFLDMLTDSGVNAMSDLQQSAMLRSDDSYAGSESFTRLAAAIEKLFFKKHFLPAHQGRACENIICKSLVKEGSVIPMNYHFTTTKAHIELNGGSIRELIIDEGIKVNSTFPFKGNMDLDKLRQTIIEVGPENIPFVRMEAGTNLIGGQPFSLNNLQNVKSICEEFGLILVLDASLLADNLYFIKIREEEFKNFSIKDITKEISDNTDLIYFSARKLGFARGGGIMTNSFELYDGMKELVTLYEGFLTYGGMSVKEMEAIAIGLEETMEEDVISQAPKFIEYMSNELIKRGVPVVTPPGGLGCHLNAMEFVSHIPQEKYPAGALAAALYIVSGIRGMERGTVSEERDENGNDVLSNVELLRLALPRRVFTLSQINYAIDRISWLFDNRDLIGGLKFTEEPSKLRFFFGKLKETEPWQENLKNKFKEDFKDSL
ncbi:MAG: tryptophanase [Clostridium sp.]|nr:tryptophanase [Clostridium sp.]